MTRGRYGEGAPALAFLLLALALTALPAHGALFDDDEARKRIEAVRQRVDQIEQRLAGIEGTLKSQGLVDLLRDVEQLKQDIAALRGQQEVLTYELEQAQKRQRDLYLDLDGRLRKLEAAAGGGGAAASPPAADAGATGPGAAGAGLPGAPARAPASATDIGSEQRAYDTALDQFKNGSYAAAITGFQQFVRAYPKSPLAPSAMYWAGNAQYAQRDFRASIATQRQLIATYPDSQKVPDALLNIASCQTELKDNAGARRTLEDVVARFPSSEAAAKARQRLSGR
ncbi:MAG TPA: tol-pal system protein YbgF [Casimicrobiaceae bacterium]|nr:tol-pal system protein YbgF [Casimicrobiaceae bacterium]